MDSTDTRSTCIQLGEDLAWLEEHCRTQPDLAIHANQLRLAAALVRDAIGPFLEKHPSSPLHIAVVGGAGSGKSTVANFLVGAVAAEANPQAGFTRHPVAYVRADKNVNWPAYVGFLGPLKKLAQPTPSNLDEDVYQIRKAHPTGPGLLDDFVVWDCPDMTTWAATGYVLRLIEVCGLADVVVFVASDERYNDEVPTQFLQLLLHAGKPVIACLTKMRENDARSLLDHFQAEVIDRMPARAAGVLPIPHLTHEELADPVGKAGRYRMPLVNQVMALAQDARAARERTVRTASEFLSSNVDGLLAVARTDLAALDVWRNLVSRGQSDFDVRYQREYLGGERFPRFDEAMIRLIDLLELPGVGRIISGTLYVLRTPYRLLKGLVSKALARPASPPVPERPVMETALSGWLDQLRAETLRRVGAHPLWSLVSREFDAQLADGLRKQFESRFREFQLALSDEVERTSRAIYAELEKKPAVLNTIRGVKISFDVTAIGATLALGGINLWDIALVPLAASASQLVIDALGRQYVETQREQARQRQLNLAKQHVSAPLAEWLLTWPVSGGSSFQKLQQVLQRIPESVRQIDSAVANQIRENKNA